jgi:hypothetical protein
LEASAEHEVGVALDGVAEGWVTVERKVALPPPSRRAARGIRLLHQGSDPSMWVSHLISTKLSHLISFTICSGITLWVTFIGGIIMFK